METTGISSPTVSPAENSPNPSEITRREHGIRRYVEKRVLSHISPQVQQEEISFEGLTASEKANVLYEKIIAYDNTIKIIKHEELDVEPVDPYLIAEIRALWEDKTAQDLFVTRFSQARVEAKAYRLSELGKNWHTINNSITTQKEIFERESKKLFLKLETRPDKESVTKGKTERAAKALIHLEEQREGIVNLNDLPHIAENTDIAAQIMYEQLRMYHAQVDEGGFAWLPSRDSIHLKTIASLQNGRWPVLIGEAGTGKSEQADAAALALTGHDPTHLACTERTSERDLIVDHEIDPGTGGSYDKYKPAMEAATGFEDSRQASPAYHTGRIVRFDESGRMGSQGYAIIKGLRQLKPGDIFHGKRILPGFSSIWTTNPVGPRYPDRTDPDAALRRELSYITVDYPPMTAENPEVYEFMLATLMDKNGHIPVSSVELSPAYDSINPADLSEGEATLPDGRKILRKEEVKHDPTDPAYGSLYRLSFAVRALQDAFNLGNSSETLPDALRYTIDENDKTKIVKVGGDQLTLSSSTITLGEIASWMKGYHERMLKDNPEYHVGTLTAWIQLKLSTYLNQVDADDRGKIRAIFEHFHLFDSLPDVSTTVPLKPAEIGYLSPRVPRPMEVEQLAVEEPAVASVEVTPGQEAKIYEDKQVVLEDGSSILVTPKPISLNIKTGM